MGFDKHQRDLNGERAWNPDKRTAGKILRRMGLKGTAANVDMVREQLKVDRGQAEAFERKLQERSAEHRKRGGR